MTLASKLGGGIGERRDSVLCAFLAWIRASLTLGGIPTAAHRAGDSIFIITELEFPVWVLGLQYLGDCVLELCEDGVGFTLCSRLDGDLVAGTKSFDEFVHCGVWAFRKEFLKILSRKAGKLHFTTTQVTL